MCAKGACACRCTRQGFVEILDRLCNDKDRQIQLQYIKHDYAVVCYCVVYPIVAVQPTWLHNFKVSGGESQPPPSSV